MGSKTRTDKQTNKQTDKSKGMGSKASKFLSLPDLKENFAGLYLSAKMQDGHV